MSIDDGYARCALCRHVYRPDVASSVDGHRTATGHDPTPGGAPAPPTSSVTPDDIPATVAGRLLVDAATTIGELRGIVDGLGELAATWSKSDDVGRREAAAELTGYLARPRIYAYGGTDD